MADRMKEEKEEKEGALEEAKKNKPSAASIFGKPVDTTQRDKEIKEKLAGIRASRFVEEKSLLKITKKIMKNFKERFEGGGANIYGKLHIFSF